MSEQTKYLDEVIVGERLDVWRRVRGTGYEYRYDQFGHEVRTGTKFDYRAEVAVGEHVAWESTTVETAKRIDSFLRKHWFETAKAKP